MGDLQVTYDNLEGISSCSYTLSRGHSPGIINMVVNKTGSEFNPPKTGDITIGDGDRFITISNCKLIDVTTASNGQHILRLEDGRWAYKTLIVESQRWNVRADIGETQEIILPETLKDPDQLAEILSPGILGADNLLFDLKPECIWDYTNRYEALNQLCEQSGCILTWTNGGEWKIFKKGDGVDLLDTTYASSIQTGERLSQLTGKIKVVSAPALQHTEMVLEAVGLDSDGTIKPIDELQYKPSGGWDINDYFFYDDVSDEADRKLAQESVFKWYRITDPVEFYSGDFTKVERLFPKWITEYGRDYINLDDLLPLPGRDYNEMDGNSLLVDRPGVIYGIYAIPGLDTSNTVDTDGMNPGLWSLDTNQGIVKFSEAITKLDISGNIVEADLRLMTLVRTNRFEYELVLPGGDDGQFVKTTFREDLEPVISLSGKELIGIESELENEAQRQLEALTFTGSTQDITNNGIHPLELDGKIEQITWSIQTGEGGSATTQASVNIEHNPYIPPYYARSLRSRQITDAENTSPYSKKEFAVEKKTEKQNNVVKTPEINTEWYPAKANTGTLPPWSCVEYKSRSGEIRTVGVPTSDSQANVGVLGYRGADTNSGLMTYQFPAWVRYSGATPSVGDDIGAVSGQNYMSTTQTGFVVLEVNASEGRCKVGFKRAGGSGDSCAGNECWAVEWEDSNGGSGTMYFNYDYTCQGAIFCPPGGTVSYTMTQGNHTLILSPEGYYIENADGNISGTCSDFTVQYYCSGGGWIIYAMPYQDCTNCTCSSSTEPDCSGL